MFAVNFDWLHKRGAGVSATALQEFVTSLADLPGVGVRRRGRAEVEWRKRPSIPTAALFGAEAALPRITAAFATLYDQLLPAPNGRHGRQEI